MRNFILLLLFSVGISGAVAQDVASEEKEPKTGYRVSLFNSWAGPQLYYKGKKNDYFELEAFKMSYSGILPFERGEPIIFYTRHEQADLEATYKPYMNVVLPPDIVEPLVVLFWSATNKKGFSKILEFSHKRFPSGSYQFVNLGQTPILGYVREKTKRFQCAPFKSNIVNRTIKDGEVIPIEMITQKGETRLLVYSSVVKHRAKRRMIFFLHPEQNPLGKTVYRVNLLEDYSQADS